MLANTVKTSINHNDPNRPITIATLVPTNNSRLFSRDRIAPAMEIAKHKVESQGLLHNRNLTIKFANSNCNVADGINEAINFYVQQEVDVFFGPCCDYAAAPVARQLKYWNIPMVTPGAMARDFAIAKSSMFNYMTRVGPNFNSLVYFLVAILKNFHWQKVSLVYDPEGQKDIFDRYCHIAIDGIHYGFKTQTEVPNLHQEYLKFDNLEDILPAFDTKFGKENASKFYSMIMLICRTPSGNTRCL